MSTPTTPDLRLEPPTPVWLPAFLAMAQEFQSYGEPGYAVVLHDPAAYLQRRAWYASGVDLPPDRVPESTYWALRGDQVLAVSRLRHRLIPELMDIGGHIGYEVRPSARRQGVGTQLLALTLIQARLLGLERVLITCDVGNRGSALIIQRNGGQLEDERTLPGHAERIARYWITLRP